MRSRSGTVRTITARHDRAKLREITGERWAERRLSGLGGSALSARTPRRRLEVEVAPASAGRRA